MHHHTLLRRRLNLIDGVSSPCSESNGRRKMIHEVHLPRIKTFSSVAHTQKLNMKLISFIHFQTEDWRPFWDQNVFLHWMSLLLYAKKIPSTFSKLYLYTYTLTVEFNGIGSHCNIRGYGRWSWTDGQTINIITDGEMKACATTLCLIYSVWPREPQD